jgi:hypothetical protein
VPALTGQPAGDSTGPQVDVAHRLDGYGPAVGDVGELQDEGDPGRDRVVAYCRGPYGVFADDAVPSCAAVAVPRADSTSPVSEVDGLLSRR